MTFTGFEGEGPEGGMGVPKVVTDLEPRDILLSLPFPSRLFIDWWDDAKKELQCNIAMWLGLTYCVTLPSLPFTMGLFYVMVVLLV